jgi:hypothetical protein
MGGSYNDKAVAAILALTGQQRYAHLIKTAADREAVWGLRQPQSGWALLGSGEGPDALPLWPDEVFAAPWATGSWSDCEPSMLSLDELFDLMEALDEDCISIAGFPDPSRGSVVVDVPAFRSHLTHEIDQWY